MATLQPFAALRPRPDLAARICELPYDVMSSAEARQLAAGNPLSFLRVSKPEIDLPPETDPYAPEVYAKGRENFERLISQGALRQDTKPCFYLYRQVMGRHTQVGLVAVASCKDYLSGVIRKHELTRPEKEDDRARHIEALNAQTGPAFLTYRAAPALDEFVAKRIASRPDVDFTAQDGVRHTGWTVGDAAGIQFVADQFAKVPFLYIADGHHRSAAAARIHSSRSRGCPSAQRQPSRDQRRPTSAAAGEDLSGYFLAVVFPHDQVQILPYNRVLKDLNGSSVAQLLQKLDAVFVIRPAGAAAPMRRHQLGFFAGGKWYSLTFRPQLVATDNPTEELDVTLLQQHVLDPIFGIENPRTSPRVNFVGGIRGTIELERLVNSGAYAGAFSLFPTGVEELMAVADADELMPPKSTWFEPKLRDAMFCHLI